MMSQFRKIARGIAAIACSFIVISAFAINQPTLAADAESASTPSGQYIDVFPKDGEQIELILQTLQMSIEDDNADAPPITMMLHGPAADYFVRQNYADNKDLIDQTAKLVGHKVIEVKMCETWLRNNKYDNADLYPFINTVPFGRSELRRLKREEGYTEYSVDL